MKLRTIIFLLFFVTICSARESRVLWNDNPPPIRTESSTRSSTDSNQNDYEVVTKSSRQIDQRWNEIRSKWTDFVQSYRTPRQEMDITFHDEPGKVMIDGELNPMMDAFLKENSNMLKEVLKSEGEKIQKRNEEEERRKLINRIIGYNPETVKPLSFLEQQFAFTKSDYKVDMPSKEDEVENENDVNTRFQEIGIVEDDAFVNGEPITEAGTTSTTSTTTTAPPLTSLAEEGLKLVNEIPGMVSDLSDSVKGLIPDIFGAEVDNQVDTRIDVVDKAPALVQSQQLPKPVVTATASVQPTTVAERLPFLRTAFNLISSQGGSVLFPIFGAGIAIGGLIYATNAKTASTGGASATIRRMITDYNPLPSLFSSSSEDHTNLRRSDTKIPRKRNHQRRRNKNQETAEDFTKRSNKKPDFRRDFESSNVKSSYRNRNKQNRFFKNKENESRFRNQIETQTHKSVAVPSNPDVYNFDKKPKPTKSIFTPSAKNTDGNKYAQHGIFNYPWSYEEKPNVQTKPQGNDNAYNNDLYLDSEYYYDYYDDYPGDYASQSHNSVDRSSMTFNAKSNINNQKQNAITTPKSKSSNGQTGYSPWYNPTTESSMLGFFTDTDSPNPNSVETSNKRKNLRQSLIEKMYKYSNISPTKSAIDQIRLPTISSPRDHERTLDHQSLSHRKSHNGEGDTSVVQSMEQSLIDRLAGYRATTRK